MSWLDELRKMKERSGMTTNQIATASQIPEPTLEKLFAGKTKSPGIGAVQTLVHTLGYTLDDLFPETKNPPVPPSGSTGGKVDPERLEALLIEMGFIKQGDDLTDSDLRFLLSVGEIIRAWFAERK